MKFIVLLILLTTMSLNGTEICMKDTNQTFVSEHSETTLKDIGWSLFVAAAIPVYIVGGIVYYITLVPIGIVAMTVDSMKQQSID